MYLKYLQNFVSKSQWSETSVERLKPCTPAVVSVLSDNVSDGDVRRTGIKLQTLDAQPDKIYVKHSTRKQPTNKRQKNQITKYITQI